MAVLKNKTKRENFLVVSKIFLQDKLLSLSERGLLATMHSLPDEWDFTIKGMEAVLPDGEARIKAALDGLIKKGYVVKKQSKAEGGKFSKNIIEIYENPIHNQPIGEKPLAEKPVAENLETVNPLAEKPLAENQGQYNNKGFNNNQFNNKEYINPSIHQENTSKRDGTIDADTYRQIISENICLEDLLVVAAGNGETDIVNEMYEVICDMVCYPRDKVIIKNTEYPWNIVQRQFLQLTYEHVASVLNRIVDADLQIKNMHNYLISSLYVESLVGRIDQQAGMHDDYLKFLRGNPY